MPEAQGTRLVTPLKLFATTHTLRCLLMVLVTATVPPTLILAKESQPKDKFQDTVVHTGLKAISVKSQDNIYLVRTFSYTPQVEKKIHTKPPVAGKRVTVHYFRGTDLATKVD